MAWWQTWHIAAPLAWVTGVVLMWLGTRRKRRNCFVARPHHSCQRGGVESVP